MWMKYKAPRVRLLTFLPHLSEKKSLRAGKEAQRIRTTIALSLTTLRPDVSSLLPQPGLRNYPWCFVLPVPAVAAGTYFTGALLPADHDAAPAVVGTLLRSVELVRLLSPAESLPFWMMRALAQALDKHRGYKEIEANCRDLVAFSLPVFWRPKRLHSAQRLQLFSCLSEMRYEADFELEGKTGVDVMPWQGWPECVLERDVLWLWRQNRHGKIVESQRKSIVNPVT